MKRPVLFVTAAMLVTLATAAAQAATIDLVSVGNPGNAGELSGAGAGGTGPDRVVGAVSYGYKTGRFEVTAGQYAEFLNKVAATDTYNLYNTQMGADLYGCGIKRSGVAGGYTYNVGAGWADHPVNYVSWGDAVRFVNWLENGQPGGAQGPATTEDGSYKLDGAIGHEALIAVNRKIGKTWVLPTEDEWYKAAYHKNDGATGNYWDYPTRTDAQPDNGNPGGDSGNTANYFDGDWTAGYPYYTNVVGAFALSEGPYGTFDQGGNVREWNETIVGGSRGWRGGSWYYGPEELLAAARNSIDPTAEYSSLGFRVAWMLEPVWVAGDADKNGRVDIFDVAILQTKYGMSSGATWSDGDFDGNGTVDIFDVAAMQVNYGYGVGSSPAPVPEPSGLVLGALALLACGLCAWRRSPSPGRRGRRPLG